MVRAIAAPHSLFRSQPGQLAVPQWNRAYRSESAFPWLNGPMAYGNAPPVMEELFRQWNELQCEKSRDELAAQIGDELRAFKGNWLPWRRLQALELQTRTDRVTDDPEATPRQDDGVVLRVAKAAAWQGLNWLCLEEGQRSGPNPDHRKYRAQFVAEGDWRRILRNIIRCLVRREEKAEEWFGKAENHRSRNSNLKCYRPRKVPFITKDSEFCDNEALRVLNDGISMEPVASVEISEVDQVESDFRQWLDRIEKLGNGLNTTFDIALAAYLGETDFHPTKGAAIKHIAARCGVPKWRVRSWMGKLRTADDTAGNMSVA